jgi:hypothetical protein
MSTGEGTTIMVQGRIVWTSGDLFTGRAKTEYGSQTPKLNHKGEQMFEYGFGLAVPKTSLNEAGAGQPGHIWTAIHEEAYKLFPSRQLPPDFAMKYKDGDGIDNKGISFTQRKGYAGHLVFACTTSVQIKYFKTEEVLDPNTNEMITTHTLINEGIKCGDYVNVQLNVKGHGAIGAGKAGLYLNPYAVQLIGYGEAIVNAPTGAQIFGGTMPTMPAGATPLTAPGLPHQAPPVTAGGVQHMQAPMPAPHHAVLPQAHQPAPIAGPPQPNYNESIPTHATPVGFPTVPS